MKQRLAEIAHQVLSCFQENSSYNDYRDGDDTPFTDQEYSQLLHELAVIAYPPGGPQEGVTTMRLTLDVHYHYEDNAHAHPPVDVCANLLENVVTRAVDHGDLSSDEDFCVADYPYRIEHLTPDGFVQILPKE